MPEIHEKVKSKMTEAMQWCLTYFSFTTDAWDIQCQANTYATNTVYYIDQTLFSRLRHIRNHDRVLCCKSCCLTSIQFTEVGCWWKACSSNAHSMVYFKVLVAPTLQIQVKKSYRWYKCPEHLNVVAIWLPIFITLANLQVYLCFNTETMKSAFW